MAANRQSSTPLLFINFLKEGLLLPSYNRRLFAALFSIIIAFTCILLLTGDLAFKPLADEIVLDTKALNGTDPSSPDHAHLIQDLQDSIEALLVTGAANLLVAVIVKSAIWIIVLFATVATYSGELHHTFGSLLVKAKAQLKGPVLTLAFVYALEIAYAALLAAMCALLVFLMAKGYLGLGWLFLGLLLLLVPVFFLVYFTFLCSLSVVVAVAEPGCHGAGALGRAWRLMKGKRRRAMLFVAVTGLLSGAVWRVYSLAAKACALTNLASGLLPGFLYVVLMSAVQLFADCAITAFYYECKGSTEASTPEYVKLPTKEQIDA